MFDLPRRLLQSVFRISTQLYLGIGGAVALTIVASLVGWLSFDRVGDVQSRVTEGTVPEMAAAFGLARQSGALVAAAPQLVTAATPAELERIVGEIAVTRDAFAAGLAGLLEVGADRTRLIRDRGGSLIANVQAIEAAMVEHFALAEQRAARHAALAALRDDLTRLLVPLIDDQLFYAMTGFRELDRPPAAREQHFSAAEIGRYRHLAELRAGVMVGTELLFTVFNVQDAVLLEPLRERFEATTRGIDRHLAALGSAPLQRLLAPPVRQLAALGGGAEGGFALRERELALDQRKSDLLAGNRDLATALMAEAETLVADARIRTDEATQASADAIATGRNLLLGISLFSLVCALLIGWLFVGRVLSRRLGRLSERMRRMAEGDLEGTVDIAGRDEVADMAAALEVFRRHALEVQRLNLVEKLAEELRGKNDQLESALGDLERAQDQIVMREKLAALGELTAGVAHEIRNPLNFIKNFSEVSEELLEEMMEELPKAVGDQDNPPDEESRAVVDEITTDLTGNLQRIREHGARANQIVQSMLMMGRGSAERQPADLNALLSSHARLAYHNARVSDPEFRIEVKEDFDPSIGEIEVIPQDLGRVFLNMVTNACHAAVERQNAAEAKGESHQAALSLTTRRQGDRVEVRIRDNGTGIPQEIIDKIFNPFFTTKPTDKGTGLGLSLSSDIVREHGGHIRVESEPGAFTEMIVDLPLAPARADPEPEAA